MAQYKVPQDVEADDKLIGPFSFRQFVYLLMAGGLIALAVGLFQIFPLLAFIPLPFILLLGALALPLKKDQPMETYLAALVLYFLKPRTRTWVPGQRNSVISVTAPKKVDEARTRDITGEEATHRLSFLAGIVDTQGYAIKGVGSSRLNDDLLAEAQATTDMFETGHFDNLVETISKDEIARHENMIRGMKEEIRKAETNVAQSSPLQNVIDSTNEQSEKKDEHGAEDKGWESANYNSDVVVKPKTELERKPPETESNKKVETKQPKPSIIELAHNADFSVATIAKQANRIKERDEGEVFISLH